MTADTLLADACGICYTQQAKYRCPGCNAKTCSLPCYKQHQQRASCTGKRNPAAYLKKSQWATPAAIDQDYNYLRSVERAIDQAGPPAPDDGLPSDATLKNVLRGKHPESRFQRYLSQNRIRVENAPIGISRQKSNQTRSTKNSHIVWTIEWILPDQDNRKHLEHDCLETTSIAGAYASLHTEKSTRGTKRKREAHATPDEASQIPPNEPNDALEERTSLSTRTELAAKENTFYLLRPNTTSSSKILIPLDPTSTITQILSNRTLLEYPTIYIFPSTQESSIQTPALPKGYMLEQEYLSQRKDEDAELDAMIGQTPDLPANSNSNKGKQRREERREQVDAEGILEMLKRDVGR